MRVSCAEPLAELGDVLRPLDSTDNQLRREPVSLKRLRKGDCSWATVKRVWPEVDAVISSPRLTLDECIEGSGGVPPVAWQCESKSTGKASKPPFAAANVADCSASSSSSSSGSSSAARA